ncbi:pyridoxal phosphate phosphatase PHOSPHO2-like [Trichoplusia ni]|uniref:Pyridoxal phosphate phosphatase PHOSPHO2-like n=1 Tax=Trichoplusia ni TaxID=7111 RepID=A0A7E5WVJ6_TRINI|nr:pyridoxal phosphate phosphatase PHOSPHO2-like [Trichoplusia ni]
MKSLAIFDFDRTIVDDDSDATIINRLKEKQPPPEWEAGNHDWTPYMSNVFEHAYSAGMNSEEILSSIESMKPINGAEKLITTLAAEGWDIIIISDANTVFINHWLKTHGLMDCITAIFTNGAFWQSGRLFIKPCMNQTTCPRCPSNLCKKKALTKWLSCHTYASFAYCGDGRNDFCPSTAIPANGIVLPRYGYPLNSLIEKDKSSAEPLIKAKVCPWVTHHDILSALFPEKCPPQIN